MVPCISTSMKTSDSHRVTAAMAMATPRYLPSTNSGRGTGLLTTVSTVRFSISRFTTPVARKAARIAPAVKMVDMPMSTYICWSSCMVKAAKGFDSTISSSPITSATSATG